VASRHPDGMDVRPARVCLEAGGLRIRADGACSRLQTVPQLSLLSGKLGRCTPNGFCPKFACDQDGVFRLGGRRSCFSVRIQPGEPAPNQLTINNLQDQPIRSIELPQRNLLI
jgi:hypothetical protein